MKYLIPLQAGKKRTGSQDTPKGIYAEIEVMEQGKVRTHKNECCLSVSREIL